LIGSGRLCFYCNYVSVLLLTVPTVVLFSNFVVFVLRIQVGVNYSNRRLYCYYSYSLPQRAEVILICLINLLTKA